MHFVGMLAFYLSIPVFYHVPTVVFSLAAAIAASFIAFMVVSGRSLGALRLLTGGVLMGSGIVTMHYSGMAAMRLQAVTTYDPLLWTLSAAIAVGVSLVGLILVYRLREQRTGGWNWHKVVAAVVMGLAIPSMHYTGMAAAGFFPTDTLIDTTNAVGITVLSTFAVLIGTFLILGTALTIPRPGSHRPYTALPLLLVLMGILALGIGGFALHHIEQRLLAVSGESLALAAADIADKLDHILYERYGDIQVLAQAQALQGTDASAKTRLLNTFNSIYNYYAWIAVTDARGRIVAAIDPNSIGLDRSDREWFRFARDSDGVRVRDASISEDTGGVLTVAFTAPIKSPAGKFLGVVTSRVKVGALADVFRRTVHALQLQHGKVSQVEWQFLTRDGEVIVDSILRQEGQVNLKNLGLPSALLTESAQPGYIEETHLRRHVRVISGYAQTEQSGDYLGLHWGVLVRMDRTDVLAPIRKILWKLGLAGVVVFVPMIGFLIWTTRQLRREWAIAQEERDHATVAEMAMRESEQRYRNIVNNAGDIIYRADAEGRFTLFNPTAVRLLKYSEAELLGQNYLDLVRPDHRKAAERFYGRQFIRKIPSTYFEVPVLARDGSALWIGQNVQIIVEGDRLVGFQAVARDTTERRRAEEALRKTNAELRQAMQEVKVLRGFIPICSSCKKIRNDGGYWQQIESYIQQHSEALFSHGVCPDCYQKLYAEYPLEEEKNPRA
jgi:PAS domain S-box-containing protein